MQVFTNDLINDAGTFRLRTTITANYDGATFSDEWDLELKNACIDNEISQDGDLADVTYYIDNGFLSDIEPSVSMTVNDANCQIDHTLEFYDTTVDTWMDYSDDISAYPFVYNWNPGSTGILSIMTEDWDYDDFEDNGPFSIQIRIISSLPASSHDNNEVMDEFTLTIKDRCRDVTVSTAMTGFTYGATIGQDASHLASNDIGGYE